MQQQTQSLDGVLDEENARIQEDMTRLILQYLHDAGFHAAHQTLHDEAHVRLRDRLDHHADIRRLRKVILEGDWADFDKLALSRPSIKANKPFLYAVYKQQYLELLHHHDMHKAFQHLIKKLKPLEACATTPAEFRHLCYLLTCSPSSSSLFKTTTHTLAHTHTNIHTSHTDQFRQHWDSVQSAREKLVEQFSTILQFDTMQQDGSIYVPPHRLTTLLKQALAYQIQQGGGQYALVRPKITTLLEDYTNVLVPDTCWRTLLGHTENIKCVQWLGERGDLLVSGSSDRTLRLWDTRTGECTNTLEGHDSRIWDVDTCKKGVTVLSASADGTVRRWDLSHAKPICSMVLGSTQGEHRHGDVYTTKLHPGERHAVSAGYDKLIRLWDLNTGQVIKTFSGHQLSVTQCIFNPYGNLLISGSKDNTIKFHDLNSNLPIRTLSSHLSEISSIALSPGTGSLLLSSSKDNSLRLWDVRMCRPIRRYKGHRNTRANFVRCGFAAGGSSGVVASGSEDGCAYIWDTESGDMVQRLGHGLLSSHPLDDHGQSRPHVTSRQLGGHGVGHKGVVYHVEWHGEQRKWVTCADDSVKIWTARSALKLESDKGTVDYDSRFVGLAGDVASDPDQRSSDLDVDGMDEVTLRESGK